MPAAGIVLLPNERQSWDLVSKCDALPALSCIIGLRGDSWHRVMTLALPGSHLGVSLRTCTATYAMSLEVCQFGEHFVVCSVLRDSRRRNHDCVVSNKEAKSGQMERYRMGGGGGGMN